MKMSAQLKERNHAKENAKAWLHSIYEMTCRLDVAVESDSGDDQDAAREAITESALSVEVRDGWRQPGTEHDADEPEEYRILLTTGGPALRIIGELGRYNEPASATLQWQDWGTPWTDYDSEDGETHDSALLKFVGQFWFGES